MRLFLLQWINNADKGLLLAFIIPLSPLYLSAKTITKKSHLTVKPFLSSLQKYNIKKCMLHEEGKNTYLSFLGAQKAEDMTKSASLITFNMSYKKISEMELKKSENKAFLSLNKKKYEKFFTLNIAHKIMGFCQTEDQKKSFETKVEIWSLTKKSITNLFKIPAQICSNISFSQDGNYLIVSTKSAKKNIHIFNVSSGIPLDLPVNTKNYMCFHYEAESNLLYCYNSDSNLVAITIPEGKNKWASDLPETMKASNMQIFLKMLNTYLNFSDKRKYNYLELFGPQYSFLDEKDWFLLFRIPEKYPEQNTFYNYFLQIDKELGNITNQQINNEDPELDLINIMYSKKNNWLIGEDLSGQKKDINTIYVLDYKNSKKYRFSAPCSPSFTVTGEDEILTCGSCDGKSRLGVWIKSKENFIELEEIEF